MQISLSNRQRHLRINRAALLSFLRAAATDMDATGGDGALRRPRRHIRDNARTPQRGVPAFRDLSVALVDDDAIADINQRFLNHAGPTDVISFDLGGGTGEIIVSAERAVIVAKQLHRKPADEFALYLIHGLLHLAGMDDQTPAQRRAIRAAERRVLRQLRPYALRITHYASQPGSLVTRHSSLVTSPCP